LRIQAGRVGGIGCGLEYLDGRDETVATPRYRLDIAGLFSRIVQGLAQFGYSRIQAALEIDKRVGLPQARLQTFASNQVAGAFQKRFQDLYRLFLNSDPEPIFPQLSRGEVHLEWAETAPLGRLESLRIGIAVQTASNIA
jgi:hypothetical protein